MKQLDQIKLLFLKGTFAAMRECSAVKHIKKILRGHCLLNVDCIYLEEVQIMKFHCYLNEIRKHY